MRKMLTSWILGILCASSATADLVLEKNDDFDVEVKVEKPNKFKSMISSFSSTVRCSSPPPGLSRISRGVDAAYLDLLPMELNTDDGYRMPVFEYTCNDGKKVRIGTKQFDMPDQIAGTDSVPGGLKSTKIDVFRKLDQVIDSMKLSVGIGDALGLFMLSPSLNMAHSTLTNTSRYIEEVSAYVSAFRADHAPSWFLEPNRYAKMYIDKKLNKKFQDEPKIYETFIKNFGTHYFKNAIFGGMLKMRVETEREYFETSNTVGVGLQAEGLFGEVVKLKGGIGVSNTRVDGNFRHMSRETMRYFGGFTNLLDKAGIKEWMPTVIDDPWLFRGDLVPIYELIEDEEKKASMKLAVQVHLDKAYLTRLKKMIQSTVARNGANSDTNSWMSKVEAQLAKPIPDHNILKSFGTQIEFHLDVPDWFKENVRVCFEWNPQSGLFLDGNQCAQNQRGLPRKLCSKFGEFTREYLDETDLRPGGCQYSWRLEIYGQPKVPIPSYFNNVEVCHKWHAQGDAGQCNGGRRDGTNCARVGSSTARYMDDTDWRGGGCEYAWMMKTPGNAPMWLKNMRFCFKWRANGDRGQCGRDGLPDVICSKSNVWTTPYKDDSDNRHGGCLMSWGIKA